MEKIIGFDFGTTNSLISVVEGGKTVVYFEGGFPHPSVVCYQGDQKIIGKKAKDRLAEASLGVVGNIVRSPKTLLGEPKVDVDGVVRSPVDIVSDVVSYVREKALQEDRKSGNPFDRAVVTIPVDMNGQRRKELREAFSKSGIAIVQFVHEPLAALYGHLRTKPDFDEALRKYNRELVLVFDWGGGTLDLTLCRILDGMLVQIKNDGCHLVGGDSIDEMIRNTVIQRTLAKRGVEKKLPVQTGGMERLLDNAERAKIELSTKDKFTIYVPDFFNTKETDVDLEYELTRAELESICEEKVLEGIARVHALLSNAQVSSQSISLCLATGGMVNMPLIKSRMREIFGAARLEVSERGNSIISEGAAWIANDRKKLSLAKNIELFVAINSYFPIIKAGTLMPCEGEFQKEQFNLYCTDPRDSVAKFQIGCPLKPGRQILATEPRIILDNLSIKVDPKANPFFERLTLDVMVDENLVLTAVAHSTMARDRDSISIHNIEFGLELSNIPPQDEDLRSDHSSPEQIKQESSLSLRPNVSAKAHKSLVPGELMEEIDSAYMYHGNPPQRQKDESYYYLPCSICKRAWSDPDCKCTKK